MTPPVQPRKLIYLSLGSNRGDRLACLRRALELLGQAGIRTERLSSFYRTQPRGFKPQPWFLNCVAEVTSELMPLALLRAVKRVERELGRRRGVEQGPRPIDIDILLYENLVVRTTALTVPHPRMEARRFVLAPLRELAPGLRHPMSGLSVSELLRNSPDRSQVVRYRS